MLLFCISTGCDTVLNRIVMWYDTLLGLIDQNHQQKTEALLCVICTYTRMQRSCRDDTGLQEKKMSLCINL